MADRRMTKSKYRDYLGSRHWQQRRKVFLRNCPACFHCGLPRWVAEILYDQDLHVHHTAYNHLGDEPDADLEALCRRCHDIESHGRSDFPKLKSHKCPECPMGNQLFDPRAEKCDFCLGHEEGFDVATYMATRKKA